MIVEAIIFLITFVVGYYVYRYIKVINMFKERGVKFLPGVPVFGNILGSTLAKRHMVEDIDDVYKSFPDQKYVGYIEGTAPLLLIRDPELIKNITVKDFDHFVDHKEFFSESVDSLFGGSLIQMKGDRWRDMRTTLSPAFTGSKMRLMMPFMAETTKNVMEYLKDHTSEELNFGDLMHRYTNDVIASAAFGLQCNSVKDPDNEFYQLGQKLFVFTPWQRVVFFLSAECPRLSKLLGLKLFNQKTHDFFRNIVVDTMKFRQENNVERPDMIQLLMEASKGTLKSTENGVGKEDVGFATTEEVLKAGASTREWTQTDLISQVFIFFVAGFESSANGLVMAFHELALNPEVQDKLYQELKAFEENNKGLVYENIGKLKYLDCVINETLRKWSPAIIMDRVCNKPYVLPPPVEGGKPYKLSRGEVIYNMVNSIQMDPQYYPHPEKFDPDRFNDDNKHNIQPFTFMPFGMGPRNCIGSRFALLELKVLLYNIILKYKLVKSPKTVDPIVLDPTNFTIGVKGGTWVILESRN